MSIFNIKIDKDQTNSATIMSLANIGTSNYTYLYLATMLAPMARFHSDCTLLRANASYLHGYFGVVLWASYQIRKIAGCACAGNAGNVSFRRRFQRKPLVSDPGMHHGTCLTHVPWCMSGSLTCGDGENVPGIPGACAPAIMCIWQEAHGPV